MLKIDLQAEKINAYKKQETICGIIVLVFAIIDFFHISLAIWDGFDRSRVLRFFN